MKVTAMITTNSAFDMSTYISPEGPFLSIEISCKFGNRSSNSYVRIPVADLRENSHLFFNVFEKAAQQFWNSPVACEALGREPNHGAHN